MKLKILLVAILVLVFEGSAAAAIDYWVDQNGVVTSRVTASAAKPQTAPPASSPAPPVKPAPAGQAGVAGSQSAPIVPQVELYVTSWCPYCKQAKEFFRAQGISFTAYDIEEDSAAARHMEELDSRGGVPLAIINGQKIHGFSEIAYREALKKKP